MLTLSSALRTALSDPSVQFFRLYEIGYVVPAWSGATAYARGDLVTHNSVTYEALQASTNVQPPSVAYWAAINNPACFTDFSQDIIWNGKTYTAWPIKCGDITQNSDGQINDVSLTVGNLDEGRFIQRLIENYEVIGQSAVLRLFVKDSVGAVIDEPINTTFRVAGAKALMGQVTFSLSLGFDFLLQTVPARIVYAKFCRWKAFKDAYCKYAGAETTCERTWDNCVRLGNMVNFGGFPAIINHRFYF